ncbi:MAG: hypothetical protein WBN66_04680 [Smithella sp.]
MTKTKKTNPIDDLGAKWNEAGGGARKTQIRMKSLTDVRRFMARVINDLDDNRIFESKARTLGYLCSVLRDIIRDSDLEERILKLEMEIKKNGNKY